MSVLDERLEQLESAIAGRSLLWFGIRGLDARRLELLESFTAAFSITAPHQAAGLHRSCSLEQLTHRRVDLDAYDIDLDPQPAVDRFRHEVLAAMAEPSVLCSYRPSVFIATLGFATRGSCEVVDQFVERQRPFEHKPWVETSLEAQGVRTLGWRYLPRERRQRLSLDPGPSGLVLRPDRSSGGVGISLVTSRTEAMAAWEDNHALLMGVAPYLDRAIPLNVGGCVYADGSVTLQPASLQLIGIPNLTDRPFGYCGNDFAAVRLLSSSVLDELDRSVRLVGTWLSNQGYRGGFGADYLLSDRELYFAEVNARLQGSTRLATALVAEAGHLDPMLEHLASQLGLPPLEDLTLNQWAERIHPAAQLITHRRAADPADAPVPRLRGARRTMVPDDGVVVEVGGVFAVDAFDHQVTDDGFHLFETTLRAGQV